MKIISITTVKNEADIIESFVRYHLNIVDQMIILNNGSTDDTNYILNQLLNEDLPLIVIEDKDKYFKPVQKMNFLLKKAIEEYGADIVCPIDVDEFITSDSDNPRKFIENIDSLSYYKIKWRTYVPTENDNVDEKFIPFRMTNIRDENLEEYKVILHKDLYNKFNVRLSVGSHDLSFDRQKYSNQIKCVISKDLAMAHFPLRSKEQTISKVLVSYPNLLCRIEVDPNFGFHKSHYAPMFFKIKHEGNVSDNDVIEFAKRYSTKGNEVDEDEEIKLINKPLNVNFCHNLKIKYEFVLSPLSNVLEHYVYLAKEINKFKKDKINDEKKYDVYCRKLEKLKDENYKIKSKYDSLNKGKNKELISKNNLLIEDISNAKELINYETEISHLKNKLNGSDAIYYQNIIQEQEKTIKILSDKNSILEENIRILMDEKNFLKKLDNF